MNSTPMKKVLIALDYNPTAQKVAETGLNLGQSMNAEIYLLNVVVDPMHYPKPDFSHVMGYSGYMDVDPEM